MLGTTRQLRQRGTRKPISSVAKGNAEIITSKKRRVFGDVSNRDQQKGDTKPAAKKNVSQLVPALRRGVRSIKTATEMVKPKALPRRNSSRKKTSEEGQVEKETQQLALSREEEDQTASKPRTRSRSSVSRKSTDSCSNGSGESELSRKRAHSGDTNELGTKKVKREPSQAHSKAVKSKNTTQIAATKHEKAEPGTKVDRGRSRAKATRGREVAVPKTVPRELCTDFLTDSNFTMVREHFDASKFTAGISEHDLLNKSKECQVPEYVADLYQRLYAAEPRCQPAMYMEEQKEINGMMRAILIDWLVEVHMKFKLAPETLFLCVNIIDRYCSRVEVERRKLQLVGVTALLLACKYEEIYPPEVRDCVYITDRAYTRQDVLDMEQDMVKTLEFRLTVPTGCNFLTRYLLLVEATGLAKAAASYYLERTLQEYDFIQYRPSLVAAAAVSLALNNPQVRSESFPEIAKVGVPASLLKYTGYSENEVISVGTKIAEILCEEVITASRRQLVAVKRKYDTRKYYHVSTDLVDPESHDLILD